MVSLHWGMRGLPSIEGDLTVDHVGTIGGDPQGGAIFQDDA